MKFDPQASPICPTVRIFFNIKKSSKILDLGCGTGSPIASYFIEKGFKITGVDGSKMVDICKKRFPNEKWLHLDMRTFNLKTKFDVILAWNSLFHLQKDEHMLTIKNQKDFAFLAILYTHTLVQSKVDHLKKKIPFLF